MGFSHCCDGLNLVLPKFCFQMDWLNLLAAIQRC
nr:MAG TPA: hypothetical protein [Caudoviricetes sp.]